MCLIIAASSPVAVLPVYVRHGTGVARAWCLRTDPLRHLVGSSHLRTSTSRLDLNNVKDRVNSTGWGCRGIAGAALKCVGSCAPSAQEATLVSRGWTSTTTPAHTTCGCAEGFSCTVVGLPPGPHLLRCERAGPIARQ